MNFRIEMNWIPPQGLIMKNMLYVVSGKFEAKSSAYPQRSSDGITKSENKAIKRALRTVIKVLIVTKGWVKEQQACAGCNELQGVKDDCRVKQGQARVI